MNYFFYFWGLKLYYTSIFGRKRKKYTKKLLSKLKKLFSSPYFVDGDLLDALTGDDGHLDVIKVHDHDDNLSTEL